MIKSEFQDSQRESEMRQLFGLSKDKTEGRSGTDAFLQLDGKLYLFELKSTSKESVTTARDFGPDHIKKWKDKHWIFGFYKNESVIFKYLSPSDMDPWIREKEYYIAPDFALSNIIPSKLELPDLHEILGSKPTYTLDDAKRIQKDQYSIKKYRELMDTTNGYTPDTMLVILRDRAAYISKRGSTLNNPHIPGKYFSNFPIIDNDHVETLKRLVKEAVT